MEVKKIAAAIFALLLGCMAMSGAVASNATLMVLAQLPAPSPCDVTLDGQKEKTINLGEIDPENKRDLQQSKTEVKIACDKDRQVRLQLKDNKYGVVTDIDPDVATSFKETSAFLFNQEGKNKWGGFYFISSSNWKTQDADQEGFSAADIIEFSGNQGFQEGQFLKHDFLYAFQSKNTTDENKLAAKIITGDLQVQTRGDLINPAAGGAKLKGMVTIEASYL